MAPIIPQSTSTTGQTSSGNGEAEISKLQRECEQLRRSLAAAEKERDENRSMLYAYIRSTITDEEKAETEKWAKDILETGGEPVSVLLDYIKNAKK